MCHPVKPVQAGEGLKRAISLLFRVEILGRPRLRRLDEAHSMCCHLLAPRDRDDPDASDLDDTGRHEISRATMLWREQERLSTRDDCN
jgi:hypothetical protein